MGEMKKKYLITGGSGFLGAALTRKLIAQGCQVRVLDNLSRGQKHRLTDLEGRFEFVRGDVRDAKVVQKALKGVDSVCHLAFVNGTEFFYTKPELVLDVGVRGMMNVLDGCIKEKVGELVLVSSSEVYQTPPQIPTPETVPLTIPDPLNPRYSYAAGKMISEILAINYGRKHFKRVLIVRPHNVYGPDMGWEHVIPQFAVRLKKLMLDKKGTIDFPIQGKGNQTRSFVYVDDFTEGLLRVIQKGRHLEIYHIGTREEVTIKSLAKLVADCFGAKIKLVSGPEAKGGTLRRCPDIQKISRLGYKPKVSLKEGLVVTCEWYNQQSIGHSQGRAFFPSEKKCTP